MSDRSFNPSSPSGNSSHAVFCVACGDGCDLRCGQCTQATMHVPWNQLNAARSKAARRRKSLASALKTQNMAPLPLSPHGSSNGSNGSNGNWNPRTSVALVKAAAAEATLVEMRSRVLPALPRKRLDLSERRLSLEKRAAELAEARESLSRRRAAHDALYAVVSEGLAHHEKNQIAGHVALLRAQRALSVLALFQLDDGRVCGSTSLRGSGENSSGGTISSSDNDDDDSSGGTSNSNRAEGEGYQPSSSAGLSSGGGRGGVPSVLNVPLPASVSLWPCVPPLVLGRALSLIGRCVEATAQALNIARDLPYSTSSYTSSVMCAPPTPLFMESDPEERGACKEENGSTGVTSEPTTSAHSCGSERENFEAALTMLQTNVLHVCFGAKVDPSLLHSDHLVANLCALRDCLAATVDQARADAHHLPLPQLPRPVLTENLNNNLGTTPFESRDGNATGATAPTADARDQTYDTTKGANVDPGLRPPNIKRAVSFQPDDEDEWEELSNDNNHGDDDKDGKHGDDGHVGANPSPLSPSNWLGNFQHATSAALAARDTSVFAHYESGRAAVGAVANRMTSVLLGGTNPLPQETGADSASQEGGDARAEGNDI